jgi:hypothetical protein
MYYFNSFPKVIITQNGVSNLLTNIMSRVEIIPSLLNSPLLFYKYDVQEHDRPDIIANKYYNDSYRYWLVLFANQIIDPQWDWPLTSQQFNSYIIDKYKQATATSLNIPVANVNASMVTAYMQSTVYQYTKSITTTDNTSATSTTNTIVIDENTYNNLITSTNTVYFNDGTSVTQKITKNVQNLYDYEIKTNEAKRNINLVNSSYTDILENQLQSLLSK